MTDDNLEVRVQTLAEKLEEITARTSEPAINPQAESDKTQEEVDAEDAAQKQANEDMIAANKAEADAALEANTLEHQEALAARAAEIQEENYAASTALEALRAGEPLLNEPI